MLIKCPNCSVKYEIPEEIGLVEGRKLKCSDCNHVFVFTRMLVESESPQNNFEQKEKTSPLTDDPVLSFQEENPKTAVFLSEPESEASADTVNDDLSATFTPISNAEDEDYSEKIKYRLSWVVWFFCIFLLFILAVAGFYYADFISADYLLGVNRNRQTEMDVIRRRIATGRRDKFKQSRQALAERVRRKKVAVEQVESVELAEEELSSVEKVGAKDVEQTPKTEEKATIPQTENVEQVAQEIIQDINKEEVQEVVTEGDVQDPIAQSTALETETNELVLLDPIVTYKDKEVIHEADGSISVRMEGSIENPSKHELVLPPVVHAIAFDENGQELFSKDIYLTNRYLDAGQTQDFFGSYHWIPKDKNLQIQWIDMKF